MLYNILNTEQHNNLTMEDVSLCIDSPSLGISPNKNTTIFSGWFLSTTQEKNLQIECIQGQFKNKGIPNRARKDVAEHFLNSRKINVSEICGFSFEITGEAVINFIVDDSVFSSVTLSLESHEYPHDFELWKGMHTLESRHTANEAKLLAHKIIDYYPHNKLATKVESLDHFFDEDLECRSRIKEFIKSSSTKDFLISAVSMALEKNRITIKSLYSNGHAYCNDSYYAPPFNYLKFVDESTGDFFYIVQHFSVFDALYAPKYDFIFAKPTTTPTKHARDIIIASGILSSRNSAGGFNGLACIHSRPYHFLYDISYGLWILYNSQALSKITNILLDKSQAYYSVRNLFGLETTEKILTTEECIYELNAPGFSIFPGFTDFNFKDESTLKEYNALDNLLITKCKNTRNRATSLIEHASRMSPIFWFGITSQKRKLTNQIKEISDAISGILKRYPKATFFIDGWTSPIKPSDYDLKEISSDETVFSEIVEAVPDDTPIFSIIGFTSEEKIALGSIVDFFISNNSTGSMHIDRICGKPGLTHTSNAWTDDMDTAIHKKSKRINRDHIHDLSNDQSKIDQIDYYTDSGTLLREILASLDEYNLK